MKKEKNHSSQIGNQGAPPIANIHIKMENKNIEELKKEINKIEEELDELAYEELDLIMDDDYEKINYLILKTKLQQAEDFLELIDDLENPYPKDIFKWNNKEKLEFNRGRFNQHCFEIWENCKNELKEELGGNGK